MFKNKYIFIIIATLLIITISWGCDRGTEQQVSEGYAVIAGVEGQGKVIKVPNEPVYNVGSVINLTAAPAEGWEFSHWLQNDTVFAGALAEVIDIEVVTESVMTAVFKPAEEILQLEVEGQGRVEEKIMIEESPQTTAEQLLVELKAVPETGWVFAGWLGDIKNSERRVNEVVVDRLSASEVTAVFVSGDYSLSLAITGEGEVRIKEIQQGDLILDSYSRLSGFTTETWVDDEMEDLLLAGSIIELTGIPEEGWSFVGWSEDIDVDDNPLQMEINNHLSLVANFAEVVEYRLEIEKQGQGRVDIEVSDYPVTGQEYYPVLPDGTGVEITAIPDPGWVFVSWSGDVSEAERENRVLNIVIEQDVSLTALFEQEQYAVNIDVEGNGVVEEKIINLPSGYEDFATIYPPGTEIEFTAQPDPGWSFNHWQGDIAAGAENDNPLIMTITGDLSLTAVFETEIVEGEAGLSGSINITHNWPYSRTFSAAEAINGNYEVDDREIAAATLEREVVEGEMIVVFNPVTVLADREKVLSEANLQVLAEQSLLNSYLVKTEKVGIQSALSSIMTAAGVRYAEPNYLYRIQSIIPDDPGFDYQWHYPQIRLPQAWEVTTGSRSIRIGVLDTGIDDNHPDLGANIATEDGYSFPDNNQNYVDNHGHGTHVAGTIGANSSNQEGVTGIMWEAEIVPIKVLDDEGFGSNWDICQGILYAAGLTEEPVISSPVAVLNMSLGGSSTSEYMEETVQQAHEAGVLMVAAAGNASTDLPMYPASYPQVISVGSVELNYPQAPVRAPYSCYGETLDIMAPGGNTRVDTDDSGFADGVLSTTFNNDTGTKTYNYVYYQGTSMAAPHVAGLAGLLLADGVAPAQIRDILRSTAFDLGVEGFDEEFGYGLINAHWALNRVGGIRVLIGTRDNDKITAVAETFVGLQDREYNLENVPAGSYQVFGWIDVSGNNNLDPGDYLATGELIEFVEGENYRVDLNLLELE